MARNDWRELKMACKLMKEKGYIVLFDISPFDCLLVACLPQWGWTRLTRHPAQCTALLRLWPADWTVHTAHWPLFRTQIWPRDSCGMDAEERYLVKWTYEASLACLWPSAVTKSEQCESSGQPSLVTSNLAAMIMLRVHTALTRRLYRVQSIWNRPSLCKLHF